MSCAWFASLALVGVGGEWIRGLGLINPVGTGGCWACVCVWDCRLGVCGGLGPGRVVWYCVCVSCESGFFV